MMRYNLLPDNSLASSPSHSACPYVEPEDVRIPILVTLVTNVMVGGDSSAVFVSHRTKADIEGEDLALLPFFEEAPSALCPRLIIVDNNVGDGAAIVSLNS